MGWEWEGVRMCDAEVGVYCNVFGLQALPTSKESEERDWGRSG